MSELQNNEKDRLSHIEIEAIVACVLIIAGLSVSWSLDTAWPAISIIMLVAFYILMKYLFRK